MGFFDWPEAGDIGDPDACVNHKHCRDCGECVPNHAWDCELHPPEWVLTEREVDRLDEQVDA